MVNALLNVMLYATIAIAVISNLYLTIYLVKAGIEWATPDYKWERRSNG